MASLVLVVAAAFAGPVLAAEPPVKETAERLVGWEVNMATKGPLCLLEAEKCQSGEPSEKTNGFEFPEGVAVGPGPSYDVYVADKVNRRIQVFTPLGVFVRMFGREVDKTTKGDVCTAASSDECQAGRPGGGAADAIEQPTSVVVDQKNGDLYVLDFVEHRIEKYTAAGEFVFMLGGNVNKKDETSTICVKAEAASCQGGTISEKGGTKPGWFKPANFRGNLLTVTSDGTLYVGDEGRVQEFDENGQFLKETAIPGTVGALAIDTTGELLLTEEALASKIFKFNAAGEEIKDGIWPLSLSPREKHVEAFGATTLAVDPSGRLAVAFFEHDTEGAGHLRSYSMLLSATSGEPITNFESEVITGVLAQTHGLAFSGEEVGAFHGHRLYAAVEKQEMIVYAPRAAAQLKTSGENCPIGAEEETNVRLTCNLDGEVNPWGVANTKVWFEWGRTRAFGERTPMQMICEATCGEAFVPVSAAIEGVRPNEAGFYFRLAAEDDNVKAPETLTSQEEVFTTPIVPPLPVGPPEVVFVKSLSTVLFSHLNPENARTEIFFEYAPGDKLTKCPSGVRNGSKEECADVATTPMHIIPCQQVGALEECVYGEVGVTLEASGLAAHTDYHYRLFAEDENVAGNEHMSSIGEEGMFTTKSAALPRATTGTAEGVGTTTAMILGQVDPDGQPATYSFELGTYSGGVTHYGVVSSGAIVGSGAKIESLELSGLQPGTVYAYRISAKNGTSGSIGATATFTTEAVPNLVGPPDVSLLTVPENLPFERRTPGKCKRGYVRNKRGICVKAKHKKPRRGVKETRRRHTKKRNKKP
jgi:hypothetical protein